MKEPENPYSAPAELEKPEKKFDIVAFLLYWIFAVPMALLGPFIVLIFFVLLWYISRR